MVLYKRELVFDVQFCSVTWPTGSSEGHDGRLTASSSFLREAFMSTMGRDVHFLVSLVRGSLTWKCGKTVLKEKWSLMRVDCPERCETDQFVMRDWEWPLALDRGSVLSAYGHAKQMFFFCRGYVEGKPITRQYTPVSDVTSKGAFQLLIKVPCCSVKHVCVSEHLNETMCLHHWFFCMSQVLHILSLVLVLLTVSDLMKYIWAWHWCRWNVSLHFTNVLSCLLAVTLSFCKFW